LLTAIVAVLTIATLYFAREILIPIALATLLAFVLAPLL
jgi:predicted PurR-regulated permease PerM